ncbi:DUF4394 domain-containing protein [Akkermansiaceae bacterium]|nr:DUF4394 domain-containing protein [Akkermansiaceae bacterium]
MNTDQVHSLPLFSTRGRLFAVILLLFPLFNPPASAGLYGLDHTSDELVKIDTETGAVSTVGPLGIDVTAFTGLDYDPSSGLLITSIPTNSDNVLYEINLDTGLATIFKIIPKTGDADIEQLGFAEDGTLYAWNEVGGFTQGDLWTVDISNGTFTKIGNSSLPNVLGADYQEGSGFWVSDEWNGRVYKLNETTAQIELTGPAIWYTGNGPGDLWDMDFGYDGLLRVAASDESLPSVLLTINQEDGSEISRVTLSREILAISSIPPTNVIPDGNTYELDLTQSSLDSSVWKTYSPTIHGHTGSHQIVQGDRLELSNAEWLYLAEPPNSVASVEGSFTLRDSYDIMWVSLNSGADPSIRTNMLPADGVNVSMGNRQGGVRIDLLGASSKVLVTAPFNFSVGQTYNFLIVDDGQNLSVKINGNEVASADYRSEPGFIDGGSNVVIQNREGWPGPHTAHIHSYKIESQDLNDGLVAYYPFNGNAEDESGNNRHLSTQGQPTFEEGINGLLSAQFDDNADGFEITGQDTPSNTGAASVSVWFEQDDPSGSQAVVGVARRAISRFYIYLANGLIYYQHGMEGRGRLEYGVFENQPTLSNGWNNFVLTTSGNGGKLSGYLNGQFLGDVSAGINLTGLTDYQVGAYTELAPTDQYRQAFRGRIQNLRIYNRSLSEQEVTTLYGIESQNTQNPAPPLVQLGALYESPSGEAIVIDATPAAGFPAEYTYQWCFNGLKVPAAIGGTGNSYSIDSIEGNEGTWSVTVTNETGSVEQSFEYRIYADTDFDGLSNGYEEVISMTDINNSDTDNDGLVDGDEVNTYSTNPNSPDSDSDGFTDLYELETAYDPNSAESVPDALVEIITAIEVKFNAALGATYAIEFSDNSQNWSIIEDDIVGEGSAVERLYSKQEYPTGFFRVERTDQ